MRAFPYAGIDGARGGWLCIELADDGDWRYRLLTRTAELYGCIHDKQHAFIDIPIGLLERGGPQRGCDRGARLALGAPRASSVFPVPCRAAAYARDYAEASALNRLHLGQGLSKQAWNITGKIREVDGLLQSHPGLGGRLRESHPEVCLWALNDRRAMQHNKKTAAGRAERVALLQCLFANTESVLEQVLNETPRRDVARDDIVDALVLAVSARLAAPGVMCLPAVVERDRTGLAMEIVYATPPEVSAS